MVTIVTFDFSNKILFKDIIVQNKIGNEIVTFRYVVEPTYILLHLSQKSQFSIICSFVLFGGLIDTCGISGHLIPNALRGRSFFRFQVWAVSLSTVLHKKSTFLNSGGWDMEGMAVEDKAKG